MTNPTLLTAACHLYHHGETADLPKPYTLTRRPGEVTISLVGATVARLAPVDGAAPVLTHGTVPRDLWAGVDSVIVQAGAAAFARHQEAEAARDAALRTMI